MVQWRCTDNWNLLVFIIDSNQIQSANLNNFQSYQFRCHKLWSLLFLATEAHDDDGLPHTLEHLIFLGSELYPYKGVLDLLANRCLASGKLSWMLPSKTQTSFICRVTVWQVQMHGLIRITRATLSKRSAKMAFLNWCQFIWIIFCTQHCRMPVL